MAEDAKAPTQTRAVPARAAQGPHLNENQIITVRKASLECGLGLAQTTLEHRASPQNVIFFARIFESYFLTGVMPQINQPAEATTEQ